MNMKAMKWSNSHTDVYSYYKGEGVWLKVSCKIGRGMDCTAPRELPRGTKFSYNVKATDTLMYSAEAAMEEYAERHITV